MSVTIDLTPLEVFALVCAAMTTAELDPEDRGLDRHSFAALNRARHKLTTAAAEGASRGQG